ncbi:hypothetical protein [uncultured Nonlabens sp.]|uniref:hypothetical protein n=1 Tax=uncultured Nonlabens sp. TaxID=859306 RepID=UPI00261E6C0A|nr:hypothetical protein [uncultured Nonlabens sp.]
MRHTFLLAALLITNLSFSQNMSNSRLDTIFKTVSDTIQGNNGRWQFIINDIPIICVTDVNHNRMRIISPIIAYSKLNEEMKTNALVANFHTALDVKYAISENLLWSVFIHPLKELTEKQVADAVKQVYLAHVNFGTTYSSTPLVFPGSNEKANKKEVLKKKTFKTHKA